jgi:uncharacterized protein involved in exopolysaccharide biosynthesis/Mrp family chromosome partitioning ATPase
MYGVNSSQHDVGIDLGQLVRAVWQRRRHVAAITLAGACLALAIAKTISPEYRSETRILIEPRALAFSMTTKEGGDPKANALLDELNIASQVQVLQSAYLMKRVIDDLKLYDKPEFSVAARNSLLPGIPALLYFVKSAHDVAEERMLDAFTNKLQVYQINNSRLIGVTFSSRDPELAAAVPNAFAQVYLAMQSGAKLDSNSEARRWLEPEIANLRVKVAEAEKKVADYRSANGLLQTGENDTFATQQLADISAQLAQVGAEKVKANARAEAVRNARASGRSIDTLTDIAGSQTMQRLTVAQSSLESQISDLSATLLNGHPRLKSLRAQLADIHQQIGRETEKLLAGIENDAKLAEQREQQLAQQSTKLRADSARAAEDKVGLNSLEREAAAQRDLLEIYLARYRESASRITKNSSPADARVVSNAVQPIDPYFPKVVPTVVVGAVASFVLTSIAVMLMELLSGRALRPVCRAEAKVSQANANERPASAAAVDGLSAPRSQSLPASPLSVEADHVLAREMEQSRDIDDGEREDFSIQSVVDYLIDRNPSVAIAISPTGDNGSTATVMLARTLSDAGSRVVLVDMTGSACPSRLMAEMPGLMGITDLLSGEAAFLETIHSDRLSDAHLVPQGISDIRLAMRGAARLDMILDSLSSVYDLVLVECGAANVEGIRRLTHSKDVEIILSMPEPDEKRFLAAMAEFQKAGYEHLILMSGGEDLTFRSRRRDAA